MRPQGTKLSSKIGSDGGLWKLVEGSELVVTSTIDDQKFILHKIKLQGQSNQTKTLRFGLEYKNEVFGVWQQYKPNEASFLLDVFFPQHPIMLCTI